MKRSFFDNVMLVVGISVCFCGLIHAQPPKVAVDVAVVATEAAKEDQPILPDDFAQAGGLVRAEWESVPWNDGVGVTLYTSDGDWCAACKKQELILKQAGGMKTDGTPVWPFRVRHVDDRAVPVWIADTGESIQGVREPKTLKVWIEHYSNKAKSNIAQSNNCPEKMVVTVDGSDSRAVLLALHEAIRRQEDTQPAVTGFLPAIPIDLDDSLLKTLDGMLSKDGYAAGGLKLVWPAGERKISFEPGLSASFTKVVEVSATVHSISINGRDVTLQLSGTIIKELTVRLK